MASQIIIHMSMIVSGTEKDPENGSSPKLPDLEFDPIFSTFQNKEETVKLTWTNIEYSVGGKGKRQKMILKSISGECNPGELVAIMGPSGSGKTTLLNVLAGRVVGGGSKTLKGSVKANGEQIRPSQFRSKVAYVTQEDALL